MPPLILTATLTQLLSQDGSGLITFAELEHAVRSHLKVTRSALSDAQLQGLWIFLDEDRNGSIDAGEFGRFMRKAARAAGNNLSSSASDSSLLNNRAWRPTNRLQYEDVDADDEEEARRPHALVLAPLSQLLAD